MKRRLIRTLITGTVVSSLIVAPVYAAPQDEVKSLESQKSQAEAQAASVNQDLVDLLVEYEALQQDMKNQEKKIDQAGKDLEDAEEKEKQQYEDMKLRIVFRDTGPRCANVPKQTASAFRAKSRNSSVKGI